MLAAVFLSQFCFNVKTVAFHWPLFVYFCSFHITIQRKIEKSVDVVLWIQTWDCKMVGADGFTEL